MEANGGWRGWGSGRMIKTNHSISFVTYFKLTCWLTTTILLKMNENIHDLIQHHGRFHQPGRYLHKKKVWPDCDILTTTGEGTNEPMCFMLNETLGYKINHLLSILNYKSNSLKYIYPSIFIASIRPFSTPPIWGTVIMWARCSFFFKWRASPGGLRNHCYHVLSIRLSCHHAEVVIQLSFSA